MSKTRTIPIESTWDAATIEADTSRDPEDIAERAFKLNVKVAAPAERR